MGCKVEDNIEQDDSFSIKVFNENQIYCMGELNDKFYEVFTTTFFKVCSNGVKNITIHINSVGGDLLTSLALYDFMKSMENKIPIEAIIEGKCFSGAVLFFLGIKKRKMFKNSLLLIHQLRKEFNGEYLHSDIVDEATNSILLMQKMKKIILEETSISESELDKLLVHEIYLDYDYAVSHKFLTTL